MSASQPGTIARASVSRRYSTSVPTRSVLGSVRRTPPLLTNLPSVPLLYTVATTGGLPEFWLLNFRWIYGRSRPDAAEDASAASDTTIRQGPLYRHRSGRAFGRGR